MNKIIKKSLTIAVIAAMTGISAANGYSVFIYIDKNGVNFEIPNNGSGGDNGGDLPSGGNTSPNTTGWIAFMQSHSQWNGYLTDSDIKDSDAMLLRSKGLSNADLPTGSVGVPNLSTIEISNNNINDLSFLTGTTIRNLLSDNNTINGFSALPQTDYFQISLQNNNMTDLSMLSHLKNVNYLVLTGNPFTSIKPLENLESSRMVRTDLNIEDFDEYNNKFELSSNFCQAIKNNKISLYKNYSKLSGIKLCNITDNWIVFLHSYGLLTNLTDSNEININTSINLSSKGLNDEDMPLYPLTTGDLAIKDFNLSNNNLTHVNFLTELDKGYSSSVLYGINLEGNPISDPSGLSNITEIGSLKFNNTSTFTNLSSFYNLNKGVVYLGRDLSLFDEYTNRLDYNLPFCQALANGTVSLYYTGTANKLELCTTGDEWLDFLHDTDNVKKAGTKEEVTSSEYIKLGNKGLTNADLPTGNLGLTAVAGIYLEGNNLDNVEFLEGLTSISFGSSSSNKLNLNGNSLTSLKGLESLTEAPILDLRSSNNTFTDLTPLKNFYDGIVYLSRDFNVFDQSKTPFTYANDRFCQGVRDNTTYSYFNNVRHDLDLCTTGDEWLDFLYLANNNYKQYDTIESVTTSAITYYGLYLSNKNLTDDKVPNYGIPFEKINSIDISGNTLTNLDFLNGLKELSYPTNSTKAIIATNNNISDISGLSTLTRATMKFNGNPLTDLTGLENLVEGYVYITDKTIDQMVQYTNKFSASSPICQNIEGTSLPVKIIFSGSYYATKADLCE